ncbi:MAG: hypothetical protein ACYC4L_11090 [Chloroflexota bacterium]
MIRHRLARTRAYLGLLLVGLLLAPLPVYANAVPAKAHPGDAGLLVPSRTTEVSIEREILSFDFVADVDTADVRATYYLANGAATDVALDLVFVAPGGESLVVTLDGVAVPAAEVKAELPAAWGASNLVIDPRTGDEYLLDGVVRDAYTRAWSFPVRLAAGARATLSVAYSAPTGYDRNREDYVVRHTAYSLGPARNWAGFGTLEVSARVPAAYTLAASPPLSRRGDDGQVAEYSATFTGVPADLLRIATVHAPHPLAGWLDPILLGVPTIAGLLLALVVSVFAGRLRGRLRAFLVAGTATFALCFVALPVLGLLLAALDPLAAAAEDLTAKSSYWSTLGLIAWLAVVAPFVASLVAATVAAVRSGRLPAAPLLRPVAVPTAPGER